MMKEDIGVIAALCLILFAVLLGLYVSTSTPTKVVHKDMVCIMPPKGL